MLFCLQKITLSQVHHRELTDITIFTTSLDGVSCLLLLVVDNCSCVFVVPTMAQILCFFVVVKIYKLIQESNGWVGRGGHRQTLRLRFDLKIPIYVRKEERSSVNVVELGPSSKSCIIVV